jgi:aminopeptidase N
MSTKVRRLFEQFQPEHYNLQLDIDPDKMTFTGTVIIEGKKTGRPSERITLHQKGLKIEDAYIRRTDKKGEKTYEVTRINKQDSYDEVRLHTTELLYPGSYNIMVNFSGTITRNMTGIYPCLFTHDGQDKKLIATQFESHHAREAFPCIDEPEAKATFDLVLATPVVKTVLGNTPVKEQFVNKPEQEKSGQERQRTFFETTPRMSTYLLAFAFGDLDYLESKTKAGVAVRTYATPANVKHTQFALDVAVKCLDFYNDYFDIAYPLPKADFVALPDFASGAMENWGLITFREQALIVDPANTSLFLKQYVANVVAHELTHQWFGNLVTMKWWNDLWLNESFASWMSYLAVDALFPEWQVWTQFIVDEQAPAFKSDALEHTHPISVTINHPDEIRTIFDAISYEKGASVLNMLQNYLGADDFRDGLRAYLKKHAYGNTQSTDLWAAWEEVSGKPIGEFMTAWTTKEGYPIVHVSVADKTLTQERFYLNPAANKQAETWPIPLLPSQDLGLETLDIKGQTWSSNTDKPLVLNHDRASFFRSVYNSEHVGVLAKAIQAGKLSELDRLGLLADAFEAAKAGYGSSVDAFKLLEAYRDEDSLVVWDIMAANIGSVKLVMNDDRLREDIKPFICGLTAKQLDRLGWNPKDGESHFDTLLRPTILALAAAADEPAVVKEALQRFNSMSKPEDINPDLRGVIYGTAARLGAQAEFDKLWKLHNDSQNSEERVTLSAALSSFEHDDQICQALEKITTKDVRLQDAMYWVAYSFANRFARAATWQWLKDNWDWLQKNIGEDLSFFRMPTYAARVQSDASFLTEFESFFNQHLSPAFERPIKQGIETIQWQAAWKERDLSALQAYFKP